MNIIQVKDYYEVYNEYGIFVCSADSYNEAEDEVREYLESLEKKRTYFVTYFAARSKWITKNGNRLQIPIEDYYRHYSTVEAASPQAAINSIKLPGYIVVDIQVA